MKQFLLILILVGIISGLFLGTITQSLFKIRVKLEEPIQLTTVEEEILELGQNSKVDSILFTGYNNCYTVCAKTLPILQKIAKNHSLGNLQVIFIELPNGDGQSAFLASNQFPNVKWVRLPPEQKSKLLKIIHLESYQKSHHSNLVLLHKSGSEEIEFLENFSETKFEEWNQNTKKSLSL